MTTARISAAFTAALVVVGQIYAFGAASVQSWPERAEPQLADVQANVEPLGSLMSPANLCGVDETKRVLRWDASPPTEDVVPLAEVVPFICVDSSPALQWTIRSSTVVHDLPTTLITQCNRVAF